MTEQDIDLFAGPGGWDEGVRPLGITPLGIEWDGAACATAIAASHRRLQADVSRLDPASFGPVRGLIASPPCQGFSKAGKGRGREDTEHLLDALGAVTGAWGQLEDAMAGLHRTMADHRSLLALEPLRWCLELRPEWTAWEQVPTVAPLWEACAAVLERAGYSTACGVLRAEQYGVPQTRARAVLLARSEWLTEQLGPAALPAPTHSRFYERDPGRLDSGLAPWVSMERALGWGMTRRPYPTVSPGTAAGGQDPQMLGGTGARATVAREINAGRWHLRSSYSTHGDYGNPGRRELDQPAFTVTTHTDRHHWQHGDQQQQSAGRYLRMGTGVGATVRGVEEPAPTVHFGHKLNTVTWHDEEPPTRAEREQAREEGVQLVNGPRGRATARDSDQPASTLTAGKDSAGRVWVPRGVDAAAAAALRAAGSAVRLTVQEAALLQSFPADYPWRGRPTAQFRQIGDAVPPLLARHIVAAVTGLDVRAEEAA